MPNILLNLALSLDGLIEGPNGEYDWCFTDQDYGMTEFLARCEAILLGRKSYDTLCQYDANAFPNQKKYVFSNTLVTDAPRTEVVRGHVPDVVAEIQKKHRGDLWFFGGAQLLTEFLRHDLIDEMHLSVHPLVLGSGTPLFTGLTDRKWWQLLEARTFDSGLVQLIYRKKT